MTLEQFNHEMIPILERWKTAFPPVVMTRIYSFVRDMGTLSFQRIVRSMLDTQRVAPLPKDFLEAAINERKRIFDRNHDRRVEREIYVPFCSFCGDLGVVQVRGKDLSTLMLCDCNDGTDHRSPKNRWKLPRWHKRLSDDFKREPCPMEWFKPRVVPGSISFETASELSMGWRERIRIAESYWAQTHDDGPGAA